MEGTPIGKGAHALLVLSWTAAALVAALTLVSIDVGWRPPIPLWDERARTATRLVLWLEMTATCLGLAFALPEVRWPERLRGLSVTAAMIVPGFFVLSSLELYGRMSALDVARTLVSGAVYGIALSVFVAFIASFSPKDDGDGLPAARNHWIPLWLAGIGLIVWAALALLARPPDNGDNQVLFRLKSRETVLTISVKEAALIGEKFGVLTITDGSESNGLVLEEDEWRSLLSAWEDAHKVERAGRGGATITDTPPANRTRLEIEGSAAGTHLHMSSSRGSTVDFQVEPTNFGAVSAALKQAHQLLRQ